MANGIRHLNKLQKVTAFWGGRASRMTLVAAFAAVAMVTTGGVFAFLTDSVVLSGAEAQSNGLNPPQVMDLRVMYGGCDGSDIYDEAIFSDDAVITFSPSTTEFDFDAIAVTDGGESVVDIPPSLCVANAGAVRGSINLSVLSVDSYEVGDCSDSEIDAEVLMGFAGCTDLSSGELADAADLVIREYCEGGDVGPYDSGAWDLWMVGNVSGMAATGVPHSVGELAPGASCTIDLELLTRFAAGDNLLPAAQTDSLSLTLALDLVEF